jgi:hypothetical protein
MTSQVHSSRRVSSTARPLLTPLTTVALDWVFSRRVWLICSQPSERTLIDSTPWSTQWTNWARGRGSDVLAAVQETVAHLQAITNPPQQAANASAAAVAYPLTPRSRPSYMEPGAHQQQRISSLAPIPSRIISSVLYCCLRVREFNGYNPRVASGKPRNNARAPKNLMGHPARFSPEGGWRS